MLGDAEASKREAPAAELILVALGGVLVLGVVPAMGEGFPLRAGLLGHGKNAGVWPTGQHV